MSPIFEFQCPQGHIFERILQMGSAEWRLEHPCPLCGATAVRILSAPAAILGGDTPQFHRSSQSGPKDL